MAISAWPVESEGIAYPNEFGVGTELAEWSVEREGECYLRVRHVKFVIENRIPMWVGRLYPPGRVGGAFVPTWAFFTSSVPLRTWRVCYH